MKVILLFSLCSLIMLDAYGQGTVVVTNVDGDHQPPTQPIIRPPWLEEVTVVAQLIAGADASAAVVIGSPVSVNSQGLFLGQPTVVPGFSPGQAVPFAFVRMWDSRAASFDDAFLRAQSRPFSIAPLGGSVAIPPTLLDGPNPMKSFYWIPEPSTITLAVAGFGAILCFCFAPSVIWIRCSCSSLSVSDRTGE